MRSFNLWFGLVLLFLLWASCTFSNQKEDLKQAVPGKTPSQKIEVKIFPQGKNIGTRISAPSDFERINVEQKSFAEFLRNLPLKPHGSKVHYYNGGIKEPQDIYVAVVDYDVGDKDLQQCADAIMRLRGEYLFKYSEYNQIHFNFTSGDTAKFVSYATGYRPRVSGNDVSWYKDAAEDYSYENFRKYMTMVFRWAGTYSLSKEMIDVNHSGKMNIGDVFIFGGFPGHAVIVVDMAHNRLTGETIFLLAQSYMPAQEIQVLCNNNNADISPWYLLKDSGELNTPEWDFRFSDLKRFKNGD
ncbi:MAG: DUF4846 domain-containing protein [Bacteroidota bacterium]|nr:DUF4846 domain-containing protein [Bacteroidota bacterium]